MHSELATVRGVLESLRAAIRREFLVRGLAIVVAAICAATVFAFALDWFLDLPLAVRAIHLCVTIVALVFVIRWAVVRPLATPMVEKDLAEAVEHGAPELSDRLLSALDFEKRIDDASEQESRVLMAGVVRDAAAASARLDPRLLVDSRPSRRALTVAGAAALTLAVLAVSASDAFGLWLRRGLLLNDIPWPRRTHMKLVDFPEKGPRIVTRGDDVRIVAVAEGEAPSDAKLHYEELSDPETSKDGSQVVTFADARPMYAIEGEPGRYAFDVRAASASFRLWVTGGDDQDAEPVYEVLALVPPRVASIAGKIVYPKYAGLPDADVRDAAFDVLKGSRVELAITTNMSVSSARIIHADSTDSTVVTLGDDKRSMSLTFDVNQSVDFHLELTAERGQMNRAEDDVFHLRATEDRAPDLRVLYPPARLHRTPVGIVPVKFVARDDFKIASVTLDVLQGATPLGTSPLWPLPEAAPPAETATPPDAKRVDAYRPLDLRDFVGDKGPQMKPGDVLHLTLKATDSNGNETTSSDLSIDVLSEEDFERRLSQRQGTLREELALLRRNQQRARAAIMELRSSAAGAAESTRVERGRDLQVDAGRVTNDLTQFLNGIHQVFDAYVLDRVGGGTAIEKLLPLYHEALSLPSDEEVFPASLYKKIVAEKRADRVYDPDVLGALLDILDLGDRGVGEMAPAVYTSLVAWTSDAAHDAAALERAEKSATELQALLTEIDRRMQRWGELNLIIEMARDIRNLEDAASKDPTGTKGLAPK